MINRQALTHFPRALEVISILESFRTFLCNNRPGDIPENDYNFLLTYLERAHLLQKLEREVGTLELGELNLMPGESRLYEGLLPLGTLVHILPGNSPGLAFYALLDGLLTGNINILKLSKKEEAWTYNLIMQLKSFSPRLADYILPLNAPIQEVMGLADGVSAWGGDQALESIRATVPQGVRFIPWGHKISFAVIDRASGNNLQVLQNLVHEMTLNNQQACSSPQIAYVEAGTFAELCAFAERIVPLMKDVDYAGATGLDEQSEITTQSLMQFYESLLPDSSEKTKLYEGPQKNWRLFVTDSPKLETSPLYKTLWIKPWPSDWSVLGPYRPYLQTCGLAVSAEIFSVTARNLFCAGVTRIRPLGKMTEGHVGEPHDGEYGLARFLRRVSMESDLSCPASHSLSTPMVKAPLMDKAAFQKANERNVHTDLYFKSGGSSGTPALSRFTYRDYHLLMSYAAKGLISAGLNPKDDLCVNLFFGGGLYGGFLSFYTILEKIGVPQLPMSAHLDFQYVAETIKNLRPTVVLGMPSYLITLFSQFGHLFRDNCPIKKIYFGGEHFPALIREKIQKEFSIEIIKSASYGSVDAGPLGYQCKYTGGTLHHLHCGLHHVEVLELEEDRPIGSGQLGRLVVSTPMRESSLVQRYVVGDTGILSEKKCPCGSSDLLFDLKGRIGDVFKAGGSFLNYQKFAQLLEDHCGFSSEFQITLTHQADHDRLTIRLATQDIDLNKENIAGALVKNYHDLFEIVVEEKSVLLAVEFCTLTELERTPGSGKLRHVIDKRKI
ncbi:MAG: hypothetical protein A2X86_17955 [Bdellovibrionales bacterium GWA2_49_15]|nr:MAG: hypothetical protein A2X86_17955 [Bdellovibrionales bacterium GWA2_49_15]HAZ11609.1 hypothetical protein [Bdellovibrionales bacterium]